MEVVHLKINKNLSCNYNKKAKPLRGLPLNRKIENSFAYNIGKEIGDSFNFNLEELTEKINTIFSKLGNLNLENEIKKNSLLKDFIRISNSTFPNVSEISKKFQTFDPSQEALEETWDILSNPIQSNFEMRVSNFINKNKNKIKIMLLVLTFLCWYFREQVESLRTRSQKKLISCMFSKFQESNPELITKTNSQTSETTSYQIGSSLEHQLKLNIFSEDQD